MNTLLNTSASARVGSNGRAMIALGPTVFGVTWTVKIIAVNSDSAIKPRFKLYRNVESPTTYIDGTTNGNQNTSETEIALLNLDKLVCVWEGASAGANVSVFIQGSQYGV